MSIAETKLKIQDLEDRIKQFFLWRGALMLVLNKFGTRWKDKDVELWCGVNAKMRISENLAFFGPQSTSSSYHVANTFGYQFVMFVATSWLPVCYVYI